jgi:hypothetical protein
MTRKFPLLLAFAFTGVCPLRGGSADVELKVAIPNVEVSGRTLIYDFAGRDTFYVLLTNKSSKDQRFWEAWNSWGYHNLSVEFTDSSNKTWIAKKGLRAWTMNGPTWFSLAPGETHVFSVTFPDEWQDLPQISDGPVAVTIRAIYEIAPDPDARIKAKDIWIGKVSSEPVKVELYGHPK